MTSVYTTKENNRGEGGKCNWKLAHKSARQ